MRGRTVNRQNGFTLIELLFAIGLSTMLISMAAPALSHLVLNSRQTAAINDLVSAMHKARSTAIMTNTRVTLCATDDGENCVTDASWHEGWIVFSDPDADRTLDTDESIIASAKARSAMAIDSVEFDKFLMYRPNGRVMDASINGNFGEFTFCDSRGSDFARVLIIDLSGRPRASRKLANGESPDCS